jgi:FlaA1/EpsC-like NDP-sugar epimerase
MPVARVADIAAVMIETLSPQYGHRPSDIALQVVGTKPGEKMYEELMNEEEVRRTLELKRFFAVLPAFQSIYQSIKYEYEGHIGGEVTNPYNSAVEPALSTGELRTYLQDNGLLDEVRA